MSSLSSPPKAGADAVAVSHRLCGAAWHGYVESTSASVLVAATQSPLPSIGDAASPSQGYLSGVRYAGKR